MFLYTSWKSFLLCTKKNVATLQKRSTRGTLRTPAFTTVNIWSWEGNQLIEQQKKTHTKKQNKKKHWTEDYQIHRNSIRRHIVVKHCLFSTYWKGVLLWSGQFGRFSMPNESTVSPTQIRKKEKHDPLSGNKHTGLHKPKALKNGSQQRQLFDPLICIPPSHLYLQKLIIFRNTMLR